MTKACVGQVKIYVAQLLNLLPILQKELLNRFLMTTVN